ncbi:MAG: hypothetical protein ABI818_08770, partial [Acidobacteriota bacterium]
MMMRLPEESSWVDALLSSTSAPGAGTSGNTIDEVSEAQLIDALEAMARGDIEYVILEHGDAFLQSAGDGDGPYQLECRAASHEPIVAVSRGVNRAGVRQVMLAYRRGDP